MPFYFAYGSNMETAQMAHRVPGACALGRGRLPAYAFACNKVGRDGTAKANVASQADSDVWGVVFEISAEGLEALDRFEGGYTREPVTVEMPDGTELGCEVYVSERTSVDLLPSRAYRDRMVRGAREHDLPEACCRSLAALDVAD